MNYKKTGIITLAVLAVAAGGYCLFGGKGKKAEISYETAKVERATLSSSVTATGTIEPVTEVEVGTQVSGIISHIYVDYNTEVKRGQVIAELDRTNLLSELNSAQSNLSAARSDLDYQRVNYNRYKALHDKGLVSDNEFETARLAYDQAKSTYDARTEAVKKAQTNLGYATITSPIDGVILSKSVEEGQTVAASFSTPTLFTIAQDLTDMRVIANVDEADIGGVREGQRTTFIVDAFPDDVFEGTVTQVRQEATTENNVVTYEVVISARNDALKLKPGLTANVTIYTMERTGVISVPAKALRFTPTAETIRPGDKIVDAAGEHKLWVRQGNTIKAVAVSVGSAGATRTEILGGIAEGTEIITEVKAAGDETAGDEAAANQEKSPFAPGPRGRKK